MAKPTLESANDACLRLNISTQTLYAYVSRELVRTTQHPKDSRKRLYFSDDIDRLSQRQKRGRSRHAVAQSTIDFGEPVLRSKISRIHNGEFYYRGQNAVKISQTDSLEDVFERLCNTKITSSRSMPSTHYISSRRKPFSRFIDALANYVVRDKSYGNKNHALQLLKLMANNAACQHPSSPNETIHQQLAKNWSSDPRAPDLIRRALVLCADHELNASTYATRVTASAGAKLSACILTGISTLSGDHHGGLTNLCATWMRNSAVKKISDIKVSNKDIPPGFGHRLYPNGDPRTIELLAHCPAPKSWQALARKVTNKTAAHPTLDFGLATLEQQLELPEGAGFSIFAVGRTVGWLAHCFEQRQHGVLIRPRAYTK